MSFAEPSKIKSLDPQLFDAIVNEQVRQEEHLELIASENYASLAEEVVGVRSSAFSVSA